MDILQKERKVRELEKQISSLGKSEAVVKLKEEIERFKNTEMTKLSAWDRVLLARHQMRPTALDFIKHMAPDFIEFHGDRLYRDDLSIVGGIGTVGGHVCTIIGQQKGKTLEDNLERNFAMPHPEGYRKALRLMEQAQKFNRPIITIIDTPGAYPGIGAEERGQGQAIAQNLMKMSDMTVPIIAVIIGEGGSGGALALGVANTIFMLENAIYSILSPEGYASILWKDATLAPKAAEAMKLTSYDLEEFEIIDKIIKEPIGGAHFNKEAVFESTTNAVIEELNNLIKLTGSDLRYLRNNKYRNFGFFQRFNYENLGGIKR